MRGKAYRLSFSARRVYAGQRELVRHSHGASGGDGGNGHPAHGHYQVAQRIPHDLLADNHIGYAYRRKKEGRLIALTKQAGDSDDGGDGDVGIPPAPVTDTTAK